VQRILTVVNKRWFRLISPVFVAIMIWILSSQSTLPGPQVFAFDYVVKKMGHMVVFGLLYFTLLRAVGDVRQLAYRQYFALFFVVFLYALSDEYHQSQVINRHASLYDVFFDTTGAFLVHCQVREVI
jgi:VanZ family protein